MARSMTDLPEVAPFRLATSPSHLLHRAEQLAAERFSQLVGDSLTLRQFAVLAAIAESPGLSQSNLVNATGVDRSTLADMVGRMERRGWIARTISPLDARAHSVTLAAAGATVLAAATHHARAADAAILDALAGPKRRTFINTLTKLARFADELAAKADREARRKAKREAREKKKKTKSSRSDGARKQRA